MALPKPTEENITLSQDELKYTDELKNLTISINKEIADQQDEVTKFLRHFEAFMFWINQNQGNIMNFRTLILEKIKLLEEHAQKNQKILHNIKLMTESEERLDSKKLMITIEVGSEFEQQRTFVKELNFPYGVVALAKDVSTILSDTKDEIQKDLEIEIKTEALCDKMIEMMNNIIVWLQTFRKYVDESPDLSAVEQEVEKALRGIKTELLLYQRLGEIEAMHLHLLLDIYEKEQMALSKEHEFHSKEGSRD